MLLEVTMWLYLGAQTGQQVWQQHQFSVCISTAGAPISKEFLIICHCPMQVSANPSR